MSVDGDGHQAPSHFAPAFQITGHPPTRPFYPPSSPALPINTSSKVLYLHNTILAQMGAQEQPNDGGGYGAVRSELPLERLEPYLREHVTGFKGPLEVKQFNVSDISRSSSELLTIVWPVEPYLPADLPVSQAGPPETTFRNASFAHCSPDRPGIPHSRRYQHVQSISGGDF